MQSPLVFLASGNAHKAEEFQQLAARDRLALEMRSAKELGGMPPVVEDALRQGALAYAAESMRLLCHPAHTLADTNCFANASSPDRTLRGDSGGAG